MTPDDRRPLAPLPLAALLLLAAACAPSTRSTFETPDAAVQAIAANIGSGSTSWVEETFGPGSLEMFQSGDDVADREDAARVKEMILQKVAFEEADETTRVALLGDDAWPFPIPLVREGDGWRFDSEGGREELLNRRIGRNELLTLATLHECVDAQREYAADGRDGNPPAYAQRFRSSEGMHDGLFWPPVEGEPLSPLGELVAHAATEGYETGSGEPGAEDADPPAYHGYRYRILTGQGPSAPGGERSYVDESGLLTGGFAFVAWPSKPGNSGVMTFQVNHLGIVFQKDLGDGTESVAGAMTAYDPDDTWAPTAD